MISICVSCVFYKEIKHPKGYNSYIRCLNKDKIKYPVLPVLDCDAYQEN
jgi:hypothetical protein